VKKLRKTHITLLIYKQSGGQGIASKYEIEKVAKTAIKANI